MNSYDKELVQAFSKASPNGAGWNMEENTGVIFDHLMRAFPISGTKIDWKMVPGAITESLSPHAATESAIEFFRRICLAEGLRGAAFYVGDSATDVSIVSSIEVIYRALGDLLDIPQHHYVVAPNAAWCFSFTMEGDLAFGYAPHDNSSRN